MTTPKPPYRVPTMQEIAETPWNGYRVASTFAGGGGSSTGYRMAGFRVVYANEFVPAAAETYAANARPGTVVDQTDIRLVTGAEILRQTGLAVGELDVLDGSPPCASFSTAGKRSEKWGQVASYSDTKQRTDDLFYEYARLVREIQPRVFVAENVSGLVKGVAKGYFKAILAALRSCGYQVQAKLLDASWLGVPQARQRLIFVGVRNDLGLAPAFPAPWSFQYTVRDALPWLTHQARPEHTGEGWGGPGWTTTDRPSPTIGSSPASGNNRAPAAAVQVDPRVIHHAGSSKSTYGVPKDVTDQPSGTVLTDSRYLQVHAAAVIHETTGAFHSHGDVTDQPAPSVTVGRIRSGVGPASSAHYKVVHARGLSWEGAGEITDTPSPTITVGVDSVNSYHYQVHSRDPAGLDLKDPETGQNLRLPQGSVLLQHSGEARKLTLGELRAICSFPPDYVLTGTYGQRWERMGRSVPPLMMKAIAEAVRDQVLRRIPSAD